MTRLTKKTKVVILQNFQEGFTMGALAMIHAVELRQIEAVIRAALKS